MSGECMRERFASMVRDAEKRGDVCVMLTLTLPSRFHPLHKGVANPEYAGATPRDGQEWLLTMWGKARAAIGRAGFRTYGVRVVEPHHDGTPHWHVLMFSKELEAQYIHSAMRRYMTYEGQRRDVNAVWLSGSQTAPAYLERYLAKAQGLEEWCAAWGIRQYARFGMLEEMGAAL